MRSPRLMSRLPRLGLLALLVAGLSGVTASADAQTPAEAIKAAGGQVLGGGKMVRFRGDAPSAETLKRLRDFEPPLRAVEIKGIDSANIPLLAELTELETLAVSAQTLRDADVASLAALTNLKRFTLRTDGKNPEITPAGFAKLAPLKQVETLGVGGHDFPADVLVMLPEVFPNVRSLDMNHTFNINGEVMEALSKLPNLESLGLGGCYKLPAEALLKINQLRSLESLNLFHAGGQNAQAMFDGLKGHPSLRSLRMGYGGEAMNDERVQVLLTIPTLESVDLGPDKGDMTDAAVATIARLPNLTDVTIANPAFTDDAVAALTAAPQLESVEISSPGVTAAAVDSLAKLPNLKSLRIGDPFRGPAVTEAFAEQLERLTPLESLVLDLHEGSSVSDAALEKLKAALPDAKVRISRK